MLMKQKASQQPPHEQSVQESRVEIVKPRLKHNDDSDTKLPFNTDMNKVYKILKYLFFIINIEYWNKVIENSSTFRFISIFLYFQVKMLKPRIYLKQACYMKKLNMTSTSEIFIS